MKTETKIYFTMVDGIRTGKAYSSKEIAEGWLDFAKRSNAGRTAHVEEFTLIRENGNITDECVKILDKRYNMDA